MNAAVPPPDHPAWPKSSGYELILEAGRGGRNYWQDLFRYRELLFALAWRDLAVRYKQTFIGVAWALIRPLLTMVIFTVIFGRVAHLPTDGDTPYSVLVAAGLLPWTLFSTAIGDASNSLISNANLISKVYFPRLLVPLASIATAFVDFIISLAMTLALMGYYGMIPSWRIIFLPGFILLALALSVGPGLYLTALNVKYRDFRYVIPFLVQFGLYVSPVGFSSAVIPSEWRLLYSLNPLAGVIDGFRWCLFGAHNQLYWPSMLLSALMAVAWLVFGVRRFRRMEASMADLI
ncbi:phosphate ABC transporter permease [Planctomyces sp. SCGC AG-212-M04]|nr:phosphate ABC transporter permease [Planctomyces sp. SCGC AG-212-M04]